ncbi:MAG: hypothetical protein AAB790_03730 [Patescibacteria group bacterium]
MAAALAFAVSAVPAASLDNPSCSQLKAGYDVITKSPFKRSSSIPAIASTFADNKLLPSFKHSGRFMSRTEALEFLGMLASTDNVLWVVLLLNDLERGLSKQKCTFIRRPLQLVAD